MPIIMAGNGNIRMPSRKTPDTKQEMAQGAASAPEGYRPWEDSTLSAEERYTSYYHLARAKCEAIRDAGNRPGVTAAERYQISQDTEANFWVNEFRQLKAESPEAFCRRIDPLYVAQEMVDSYLFDEKTGVSTFTVPAGVTDVGAMQALNEYFRKHHARFDRDAIFAEDLEWFEKLPQEFPDCAQERDYSQARQITITGVVDDTEAETRTTQESLLREKSLVFSDPRDQALAAAIHACKYNGEDLFKDFWVRGSVPGVALYRNEFSGAYVLGCSDDDDCYDAAASGAPYPESK
jgi:hypothetical protein